MCPGYSYLRGTNEENKLCYGISTLQIREYLPKLNYFSSIVKWKIFPLVTCYFERHHWEEFFFFLLYDILLFHFSLNLLAFHKNYTHTHTHTHTHTPRLGGFFHFYWKWIRWLHRRKTSPLLHEPEHVILHYTKVETAGAGNRKDISEINTIHRVKIVWHLSQHRTS